MAIHKSLKGLFGGDGMAWRREQKDILDWAKNLYYPESGGSLIPETDDKATWDAWKNKFLSWKDAEVNKEASGNAWWQTYPRSLTTGGEESGGGSDVGGLIEYQPFTNPLSYPMTMPEYSAPSAQDFSAYTYMSPFGGEGGLLYQPWSSEYLNRYVPQNLLNYVPPEIDLVRPTYSPNPLGLMQLIEMAEESIGEGGGSDNTKDNKPSDDLTDLDMRGDGPDRGPGSGHADGIGPSDLGSDYGHPGWGGELPV